MQLIKGGGCHGGVIRLTLNIRQSKTLGVVICYNFVVSLSHVRVRIRARWVVVARMCYRDFCVINRPFSCDVSRTVRTWIYRVVIQARLWNHCDCGTCYHPVSGSRFGSSRARWAFHRTFDTDTLFIRWDVVPDTETLVIKMRRCSWLFLVVPGCS